MTVLVVLASGNDYVVDVLAGAALAVLAWRVAGPPVPAVELPVPAGLAVRPEPDPAC